MRAVVHRRTGFLLEAASMPLGAGLLLLFVYWGEMEHPYYALVFAALSPLALCPLGWLASHARSRAWGLAPLAALVLCVPLCLKHCTAVPMMDVQRASMPQTRLAQIVRAEENATMLDWTSLDQGFYLAAGVTPTCRYFVNNNLNTEDKRRAYEAAVASGEVDFVVLNAWQEAPTPQYERVATADGVFDLNSPRSYALYRYVGEEQHGGHTD